ncbi:MAG: translocation/assembly module TamB domain-containing protein [Bacteroidota bacterium]
MTATRKRKWLRRTVMILGGFFVVLFLILFALRWAFFQNITADQLTNYLGRKLQTKVEVDHVNFTIFDKFLLNGFYVENEKGDTLLYSEKVEIDFESSFFSLFRKNLSVEALSLHNTQLNIRRDTGQYLDDIQVLLNRLKNEKQDTVAAPPIDFRLNIKEMELDQVLYSRVDSVNGNALEAFVKYGRMRVKEIDLAEQNFDILLADFRNSELKITNFKPHPLGEVVQAIDPITEEKVPIDSLDLLSIKIDQFRFRDGVFKLDNFRKGIKTTPDDQLDYNHMELYDIDAEINRFSYEDKEFKGRLNHLDFSELSGFEVYDLSAHEVTINPQKVHLAGLQLRTPHTLAGDTLTFSYDKYVDFFDFNNKVDMRLVFQNSKVRVKDIMTFASGLKKNAFFDQNKDRDLKISGVVSGTVNELSGDDLVLQLNGKTRLVGSLRTNDLTQPGLQRIFFRLNRLQSDMLTLREIIPNFSLPPNFDRLGNIEYSGGINLIFSDFIIFGDLKTNLGQASLDMAFQDISNGFGYANYEGNLGLTDFDLRSWTGNPDLGKITMQAKVAEGKGLTSETADAVLSAEVTNFTYKDYLYDKASFSGRLNPRLFEGNLTLKDENLAFSFAGTLDYTQRIPNFDFDLALQYLRAKPLNLMEKDWTVSGFINIDMDVIDNDLTQSEGSTILRNLTIRDPEYNQRFDSIIMTSRFDTAGRHIAVTSEALDLKLDGHYELIQLWNSVANYAHRNFPLYAQKLNFPKTEGQVDTNQVKYKLRIHDSGDFTKLLLPALDTIEKLELQGSYWSNEETFTSNLQLPKLRYDSVLLSNISFTTDFDQERGKIDLKVEETTLKSGTAFEESALSAEIQKDTIDYFVYYNPKVSGVEYELDFSGSIAPYDSTQFQLVLDEADVNLFEVQWNISDANYIRFGNGKIEANQFKLNDENQRKIQLSSFGKQGINLDLEGFSFGIIDSLWDYEPLNFSGNFDLNLSVGNIFALSYIDAEINSDSLMINGDHWGNLQYKMNAVNTKSTFSNVLNLTKENSRLTFNAQYNPPSYDDGFFLQKASIKKQIPNYFDAKVEVTKFPLNFLRYFVPDVSDMVGTINGEMTLNGNPSKPDVDGKLKVRNGGVTVDFLNTRYFVNNQTATINNRLIDGTGAVITDELGNEASIRGGITHDHLKDLGLKLELTSDQFLALNTTQEQNEVFYGKAIGGGNVTFEGSFARTNIFVNATSDKGTKITIPVTSDRDAPEISFIKFRDKEANKDSTEVRNPEEVDGVDLDLYLTLTDVAEVELVFDERAGDILRGQGNGNLQIYLDRTGDMAMYGNYNIEQGEYLFTLLNLVNKPFVVRKGGTIAWRGDPFNAQIDLKAEYKDLNTSLTNLIPEYLVYASPDVKRRAAQPTDVDLLMSLKGELYQPSIGFELSFPQVQGELRNYADNKLRTLEQDENELNKQVFGLIVLGQFLPSDFALSGQSGGDFGINTVSEFIANQLSILVTDIVGEVVDDVKFISDVDVDLDYNRYGNQVDFTDDNFYLNGQEYYIRQKTSLFDDKVTVTVGQNVTSTATQNSTQTFFGNDVIVDVVLNKERTLKLKVYYIRQPGIIGGVDQQSGVGLSYEKEFDSFKDMFKSIFKKDSTKQN